MRNQRSGFPFCLAAVLAGCAPYVSNYRPPKDGRARVVWDSSGEMVVDSAGLVLTPECGAAMRALTGHARMPVAGGTLDLPEMVLPVANPQPGVWQPIYYGDPIAPSVGSPIVVHHPVFFWIPGLYWNEPVRGGYYGSVGGGSIGRALGNIGGGSGGGGHGGGGGGGGHGSGEGLVIAAAVAAVTLPIIDVAVAASSPISEHQAAVASDLVAAWNDLARTPGSPCTMPGSAVPVPAELQSVPTTYGGP